jgi:hypothetical protein
MFVVRVESAPAKISGLVRHCQQANSEQAHRHMLPQTFGVGLAWVVDNGV